MYCEFVEVIKQYYMQLSWAIQKLQHLNRIAISLKSLQTQAF